MCPMRAVGTQVGALTLVIACFGRTAGAQRTPETQVALQPRGATIEPPAGRFARHDTPRSVDAPASLGMVSTRREPLPALQQAVPSCHFRSESGAPCPSRRTSSPSSPSLMSSCIVQVGIPSGFVLRCSRECSVSIRVAPRCAARRMGPARGASSCSRRRCEHVARPDVWGPSRRSHGRGGRAGRRPSPTRSSPLPACDVRICRSSRDDCHPRQPRSVCVAFRCANLALLQRLKLACRCNHHDAGTM